MFEKKTSVFVEIGPDSVLTGITKSILKENDIKAVSLDKALKNGSGIENLAHVLCLIASKGLGSVDLSQWEEPAKEPVPQKMKIQLSGANPKPKKQQQTTNNKQQTTRISIQKSNPEPNTEPNPEPNPEPNTVLKQESLQSKTFDKNKTALKGADMKSQNKEKPAFEAMKMIQKGLEAMQQLQTQTALTHEKFLETQSKASKALSDMIKQTNSLAFNISPSSHKPVIAPAATIAPSEPTH
eukprot:CAMPEP_0201282052 /NCGR_PEP_ID=MMETSP1317-20130820/4735_1 /ASSEMBLY_ACC=CAM_ASM_000770 /TAXON_ID=187299 /ORGANISM="Undescribed Undescribed, Strain Undescribed" /LENGTH=239 /DNA_ID=CAMNT_0047593721 /DNA_START=48 /DNA_END=764 /DNA_ORIENTATION=+